MKKRFTAGRRIRWGYFETLVAQNDSDGRLVEDWVPAFAVSNRMPVEITPMSVGERIESAAKQSKVTHRIRAQYRREFEVLAGNLRMTEARVGGAPVVYNIEGCVPDPDSGIDFVTLFASSGLSDAGN